MDQVTIKLKNFNKILPEELDMIQDIAFNVDDETFLIKHDCEKSFFKSSVLKKLYEKGCIDSINFI